MRKMIGYPNRDNNSHGGAEWARSMRRLAGVTGLAALPFGVFGAISQNIPVLATGALALVVASGLGLASILFVRQDGLRGKAAVPSVTALLEALTDGVMQFDAEGRVALVSHCCETLLGASKFELEDGLADRCHILDKPLLLTAQSQARLKGTVRHVEVRLRRDEAGQSPAVPRYEWFELTFAPLAGAGQAEGPYAVLMTLRDISARKTAEQQLQDASKAAQDASLAKNQFLAVIGHELRTPLNAIVGFSDLMANGIGGELNGAHLEYVRLISQSGHHLLEMVNMLLDMSKIEAGRFELQIDRFEPGRLVAPCMQIVQGAAQKKGVMLKVDYAENLPEIAADERACRQILINLLSNAVKFSERGGEVRWSMKRQGPRLKMTVSDMGIGMSDEVVARLGEAFYQAESSADRRYEGTGLGLSIVKGLVELHDGRMDIKSAPGKGTSVTISLPINGPETKSGDSDVISVLKDQRTPTEEAAWSEPKRRAL